MAVDASNTPVVKAKSRDCCRNSIHLRTRLSNHDLDLTARGQLRPGFFSWGSCFSLSRNRLSSAVRLPHERLTTAHVISC